MSRYDKTVLFLTQEQYLITFTEIRSTTFLTEEEVIELTEIGALPARGSGPSDWLYSPGSIELVRVASRLIRDFDLDTMGAAVALSYLNRIEELESRVRELECLLQLEPEHSG